MTKCGIRTALILGTFAVGGCKTTDDNSSSEKARNSNESKINTDWAKIKLAIANDIDALVSDTVNEGEQEAYVLRQGVGKTPVVNCKNKSIPSKQSEPLNCTVTFRVKPYEANWTERTCGLTYLWNPRGPFPSITRGPKELFNSCIETLNEGE